MTRKHKILKADLIVQTVTTIGLVISFFVSSDIHSIEGLFPIMIGVLAVVQVVGAVVIGFLYNDKRRKNYLKVLFWMHGMGTLFMFILISTGLEALMAINIIIFVVNWLMSPFILAFWSLANSIEGLREYEDELYSEYV